MLFSKKCQKYKQTPKTAQVDFFIVSDQKSKDKETTMTQNREKQQRNWKLWVLDIFTWKTTTIFIDWVYSACHTIAASLVWFYLYCMSSYSPSLAQLNVNSVGSSLFPLYTYWGHCAPNTQSFRNGLYPCLALYLSTKRYCGGVQRVISTSLMCSVNCGILLYIFTSVLF